MNDDGAFAMIKLDVPIVLAYAPRPFFELETQAK